MAGDYLEDTTLLLYAIRDVFSPLPLISNVLLQELSKVQYYSRYRTAEIARYKMLSVHHTELP